MSDVNKYDVGDMARRVYRLFFNRGEVVEIRTFGESLRKENKIWVGWSNGILSGYFDNEDDFVAAVVALDRLGAEGIYFTLNPCDPSLLARAANRLNASSQKRPSTSDNNILKIRWLPIDIDPVRPSGISASEDELSLAKSVAGNVRSYLEDELGYPGGVYSCSGNGYHLLYRLPDMPNNQDISGKNGLLHRALLALDARFTTDRVKIDTVNYNASRIWKLYGTWARKGDSIALRPHRQSYLFSSPKCLEEVQI